MKIEIIGAGAVGLLHGARLALGGAQVRMLTRGKEQAELLARDGIRLSRGGEALDVAVEASTLHDAATAEAEASALNDAATAEAEASALHDAATAEAEASALHKVAMARGEASALQDAAKAEAGRNEREGRWHVLAVKQTALGPELLRQLAALLRPGDSLLCLQNGIGHLEQLARTLPGIRLYAGMTSEGALRVGAREVVHAGAGELHYGPAPGADGSASADPLLAGWRQALQRAGIAAFLSNDVEDRIYRKLLLNAVINPLTALLDVPNGRLPEHPQGSRLMKALHEESLSILVSAGFAATGEEWERLLDVCRRTAANTSSMLADVRAGRPTEIASINGELARLAARHGVPAPLNEAAAALVHALE
ncbi:ketopantoate reductase family protein [Paenibacillus pasadenensis]|uniref:ketopantoate reductase family protein n=1 Tax=Paenibacillus pasadenensis TaxID=217090 RepID=UPI00040B667A|nr:2-dehydropantoate 2-reductase [Paenibacillus pasadenensis]